MLLHVHQLMGAAPNEQRHVVEGFWVVSEDLEHVAGLEVLERFPCFGDRDRAKEADDIQTVCDVGVALLPCHEDAKP